MKWWKWKWRVRWRKSTSENEKSVGFKVTKWESFQSYYHLGSISGEMFCSILWVVKRSTTGDWQDNQKVAKAIYNWKFVHHHFVASNWNVGCGGYLDNFKILCILTSTFNCGFLCALGLEKLQKTPWCNYVLIRLPNFVFIVVWTFTLFCPLCGDIYQRSTSGNLACSEW